MLPSMEKQLNESQRDALVSGFTKYVLPTLNVGGKTAITSEDLYEYLLLDPEVADEVATSRVASAIASVQTYMTRIINGSEPGFPPVDESTMNEWRDNDNQYAVWAAGAEVQNYAENYISPATRLQKSHYFSDLETALNQNQLNPDRVQDAALAYLNQFEQVSNLYVVSGYIDQSDLSTARYYFVGRTTTKPYQYYWRKLDLSGNRKDLQGQPVTPNCWSDWLPISLPLAGDAVLQHTVRPVFYNERLYVCWAERDSAPQKDAGGQNTAEHMYWLKFGYKRFDDSWTAPNNATLMTFQALGQQHDTVEVERDALTIDESVSGFNILDVNVLAITDFSDDTQHQDANRYGRLMLGVFVRKVINGQNIPDVYGYQYCDCAFNRRPPPEAVKNGLFTAFRDLTIGTNTLQFPLFSQKYVVHAVEPYQDGDQIPGGGSLHGSDPNDDGYKSSWWNRIGQLQNTDSGSTSRVYLDDSGALQIEIALTGDFYNEYDFSQDETTQGGVTGFGYGQPNDDWGVTVRFHDGGFYSFENTALIYEPHSYGQGKSPVTGDVGIGVDWGGDFFVDLFQVHITPDMQIGWPNSGQYSRFLDLSGRYITYYTYEINGIIKKNTLRSWIDQDSPITQIARIDNFGKLATVRKFYCAVRAVTANRNPAAQSGATFELDKDSAAATTTLSVPTICAADFANGVGYVSVGLVVGYHRINELDGSDQGVAEVWNWYKVYISSIDATAPANPPQIKSNYDARLGFAQYLDFCDASLPAKTRLNTTFVRELVGRANVNIDALLDYELQTEKLEAPLEPGGAPEPMDFNGANGLYFWELFFHMPFLVAWRYANEQQFADATRWLHYIFDPALSKRQDAPDYWSVRPLTDSDSNPSGLVDDPLDPDSQAYAHPVIYKKAIFIAYVSNLIAQGDMWYRQLTPDGLTQARVFYNLAGELLGSRPDVSLNSTWTPRTLDALAGAQNDALRAFEQAIKIPDAGIPALHGRVMGYLELADNEHFTAPLNSLMLAHWDTLDARLYNLRHGLTLDGKPLSLPLYATPDDPIQLLKQRAQAGTLVGGVSAAQLAVPPYRFHAVLSRAYGAVAILSKFGDSLLSLLEQGDRASQEQLQQQQLLDMSSYGITLQQQAIDGLSADGVSLQASRTIAQQRCDWYYQLYLENITDAEQSVMDAHTVSQSLIASAQGVTTASGALKMMPNIFGMADGGIRYEGATEAVASGLIMGGEIKQILADRLATSEAYRRRRQDWQIQYEQAQAEVAALDKQVDALAIRQKAAQTELARLKTQQAQIQAMLQFLQGRFTQASLYVWLSGQLKAFYYQLYDATVSLCLAAQACWQYEVCDFRTTFIQPGAWNDHYQGLQAGEALQLNLQQMESAYLARDERRLEITRTVSLAELLQTQSYGSFGDQKQKGKFSFDLTEKLFDEDYPGHYMRQIKSIGISLPTLLGPYQDIKAVLTQTRSSTLLNASLDGVKYLNDPSSGKGDADIVTNLRASQQIALSSGLNDSGLFSLNFGDERYLPFEGTGAVSGWTLAFPRASTSATQKAALDALTDVIVHVRYTAVDGGETFAQQVEGTLGSN